MFESVEDVVANLDKRRPGNAACPTHVLNTLHSQLNGVQCGCIGVLVSDCMSFCLSIFVYGLLLDNIKAIDLERLHSARGSSTLVNVSCKSCGVLLLIHSQHCKSIHISIHC